MKAHIIEQSSTGGERGQKNAYLKISQFVLYILLLIYNVTDLCLFDRVSAPFLFHFLGHKMTAFSNKDHMLSHSHQEGEREPNQTILGQNFYD